MSNYKTERIASFIFWIIGSALFIGAFITSSWISTNRVSYGLLEWCLRHICFNYEWDYPPDSPVYLGILLPRLLILAGAGGTGLGILIGIISLCTRASCPILTDGILSILGSALIWVGCIVFTVQNYEADNMTAALFNKTNFEFVDGQHFSFSYYFAWVSGVMYLAAGMYKVHVGRRLENFCCCKSKRSRSTTKRHRPKMTTHRDTPSTRRHKSSSSTQPEKSSSAQPEKSSSAQPEKSSGIPIEQGKSANFSITPELTSEPHIQNTYL